MKKRGKHCKEKKHNKMTTLIILILLIVSLGGFICSLKEIIIWYISNNQSKKIKEDLSSFVTIEDNGDDKVENCYNIDFNSIKETNEDAVAFLKVKGTNIEYIVVQGNDNKYYLNHSFDKQFNKTGWIFADYKNKFDENDKNIVIYGHNQKDGSMFGTLKNILKEDWYNYEENKKIIFVTETQNYVYETFSVYQIEAEDEYIKTNFSGDEYNNFIKKIKLRSINDFGVEVSNEDKILTLSTCATNNRYRVVLHAKRVK